MRFAIIARASPAHPIRNQGLKSLTRVRMYGCLLPSNHRNKKLAPQGRPCTGTQSSPTPLSVAWLRQNHEMVRDLAIDAPTPANGAAHFYTNRHDGPGASFYRYS